MFIVVLDPAARAEAPEPSFSTLLPSGYGSESILYKFFQPLHTPHAALCVHKLDEIMTNKLRFGAVAEKKDRGQTRI